MSKLYTQETFLRTLEQIEPGSSSRFMVNKQLSKIGHVDFGLPPEIALRSGFVWRNTREGDAYWSDICTKLGNIE